MPTRTASTAGVPQIVTRSSWEADEKITRAKPLYAPTLKFAVVHHTAGTNTYSRAESAAIVRGIEIYHVKANGWNDIGYNFLVDRFGTVYEGRAGGITRNVIGAHAMGFNTGSVGVALMGNYQRTTPSTAEQSALVHLLAWRLDLAHVDPLSKVVVTSAGNPKYRAGKVVTLTRSRATATRTRPNARASAPTTCSPTSRRASRRPGCRSSTPSPRPAHSAGRSASRGGSPRRSPWTVTVSTAAGKVVATGRGRSALVDWTWSSGKAGKGPFRWRMDAGPSVLPARGHVRRHAAPTPAPRRRHPRHSRPHRRRPCRRLRSRRRSCR